MADQNGSIDQMRLSVGTDGVGEVLPEAREKSRVRRFLGKSALVRYLVINVKLRETLHRLRNRDSRVAANVDVDRVNALRARIRTAVDYTVQHIREENPDIPVLFTIDGLRRELYAGRTPHHRLTWLHELMAETTAAHGCAYLDLDDPFRRHYEATGERFETDYNFHWNDVGHRVAAESLLAFIEEKQLLPEPRSFDAGSPAVPRRSHGTTDR